MLCFMQPESFKRITLFALNSLLPSDIFANYEDVFFVACSGKKRYRTAQPR